MFGGGGVVAVVLAVPGICTSGATPGKEGRAVMPSFGTISIASAMVAECFLWWQSVARRALRKAQYKDFESSFVNPMTTSTLKPEK